MDATVTILNDIPRVTSALRATAGGLRESAKRFQLANMAVLFQVSTPLGAGVAWNGVGQPSAKVVVDVNAKAMATGTLLALKSAVTVGRFADRLGTAHRSWQELWPSLDAAKFDLSDDGTVTVKPGVKLGAGETSAEELTAKVQTILRFVERVDLDSVTELTSVFAEVPPVTTTADPGILDRAEDAYQDALGKLDVPNPAWQLKDYLDSLADGYLTGPDGERYRFEFPCVPQGMTYEEWLNSGGWYTVDTRTGFDQLLPGVGADILFASFVSGYGPIVGVNKQKTRDWAWELNAAKPQDWGYEAPKPHRFVIDEETGDWRWVENDDDPRYQSYERNQARYDALSQALEAFERTSHANDHTYFSWEATFQKNIDGETRVLFKTYQWLDGPNGSYLDERYMYVGADGEPVFVEAPDVEHQPVVVAQN